MSEPTQLADMTCSGYSADSKAMTAVEVAELYPFVSDWRIVDGDELPKLERAFKFKNFVQALEFANRVGTMAEEQDHHPALLVEWGKVTVRWWTHFVEGLHLNDFIAAAKTDRIFEQRQPS
ncbi:MAG: 4a-hydroxytetrahydrobiopterin dehydratase [Caldilineales bacterium]|nr:4a-hydroxytetrahydrobiopterin dehydratase [Caldilineales bacterium]